MKMISLAVALLMAGSVFANEPQPVTNPAGGPQPIANGQVMHFSELLQIYQNGRQTNEQVLGGKWIQVAVATTQACVYNETDAYDSTGIKNQDGSVKTLQFGYEKVGGNDFTGTPATQVFSVRLFNLGYSTGNQGPYKVDPNEPQFAQWVYDSYGVLRSDGYFNYSCRLVSGTGNKLVCATSLVLKNPTVFGDATKSCAADQPGLIEGFVKVQ